MQAWTQVTDKKNRLHNSGIGSFMVKRDLPAQRRRGTANVFWIQVVTGLNEPVWDVAKDELPYS
jgi:hypothetical protein